MNKQLSQVLEQTRLNSLLVDAHIIRNWPIEDERIAEATRMVQRVKTRFALQEITEQQHATVLRLLSFVGDEIPNIVRSDVNDEQAACEAFGNSDCCGD